jgi:hypothetical protein
LRQQLEAGSVLAAVFQSDPVLSASLKVRVQQVMVLIQQWDEFGGDPRPERLELVQRFIQQDSLTAKVQILNHILQRHFAVRGQIVCVDA